MSGTGHTTTWTTASGDARVDGILYGTHWADPTLTYSFPSTSGEYDPSDGAGEAAGLFAATPAIRDAAGFALDRATGTAADDGFSVEGFTGLRVKVTTLEQAHIRVAQTTQDPYGYGTAWGYFPSTYDSGGDVWLSNVSFDYSAPQAGGYAYISVLHELGHALGLEHGHDSGTFGVVPTGYDAMEYTIMSYRSYPGASSNMYSNAEWGYAQSYMMLDIAALQYLYGADYSTNSGNTVYRWAPDSGETLVNGEAAISPGANRIFATIWDGGGTDTYNLSAYDTDLVIDLMPGSASVFAGAQLARLGAGELATGNIYNALLQGDDPRALIENVIAGAGDDVIFGNTADNLLKGKQGNDTISGRTGGDSLIGNAGQDRLDGGLGDDDLAGGTGRDRLLGARGSDSLDGGKGNDILKGGKGKDLLQGNDGDDTLVGGLGQDMLLGAEGADSFRFLTAEDSAAFNTSDHIGDFLSGTDFIDLSALIPGTFALQIGGPFTATGPSVITRDKGDDIVVRADLDGDGKADFGIVLDSISAVAAGDFIL
ncbi:M10 family metallopeptidase [Antarcticimicrobium sediminis]|uniref:Protease n=1 Tax=Antarcticimicrobium sediminis TaxID=2546227 RepID=A0A4R5EU66_9RHOB|nr:M10 family metallopeptidase [Antarcticimicrobium sediminis]TDE38353.1 protease [Antarcticimicrobium sediminis]